MYALAASAAGVSVLALAQTSEAKIIFTHSHKVVPPETSFFIDLNHDGISDFGLFLRNCKYCSALSVYGYNGNQVSGPASKLYASALPAGVRVGPKKFKTPNSSLAMAFWKCQSTFTNCASGGPWLNAQGRFLGFRFFVKGKVHFGWARFDVSVQRMTGGLVATLTGYAYETIPEKPIVTGRTADSDEAGVDAPDPASLTTPDPPPGMLGLLALGSPGLSAWRRKHPVLGF
jgi:hypothetical protein